MYALYLSLVVCLQFIEVVTHAKKTIEKMQGCTNTDTGINIGADTEYLSISSKSSHTYPDIETSSKRESLMGHGEG